jgi:hypothetical protein
VRDQSALRQMLTRLVNHGRFRRGPASIGQSSRAPPSDVSFRPIFS